MDQVKEVYRLMRMNERVYQSRVYITDDSGNFLFSMNVCGIIEYPPY